MMSEHQQSFSFNTLPSDEIFDFPGMNEIAKQNNGNLAALSEIQAQDANCDRNNGKQWPCSDNPMLFNLDSTDICSLRKSWREQSAGKL